MNAVPDIDLIGTGPWALNIYRSCREIGIPIRHVMNRSGVFPTWVPDGQRKRLDTWGYDSSALIVAASPDFHHQVITDSGFNGMPVFVEKPACTRLDVALQKPQDRFVFVDYTLSHSLFFDTVCRLLSDTPEDQISVFRENYGPSSRDFPVLWDWGPHEVSIYSHLGLSDPGEMSCKVHSSDCGNQYELQMTSVRGAKFTSFFGNVSNVRRNYLRIFTPDKLIEWDVTNSSLRYNGSDISVRTGPGKTALCLSLSSFFRSVETGDTDRKSDWNTTKLVTRVLCEIERTHPK